MYLHGLAVNNCLAVKWSGCQMSQCQLSNNDQTFREMAAVNVVDPSVMEYSRRTFRHVASMFLKGGTRRWRHRRSPARRGGAKRRSAEGVGLRRGAVAPPQYVDLGA